MRWDVWHRAAIAALFIPPAIFLDAYVFPAPLSSRPAARAEDRGAIALSPPLAPGTPFPEQTQLLEGPRRTTLRLTGHYVRSRRVMLATIDFYEIASYVETLPRGSTEEKLEAIWREDGRKAYLLRFLFPVPGWQLRKAVRDEISRSFGDVPAEELQGEIDRLLDAFGGGASAGDVFYLVRLPGDRVYLGVRRQKDLELVTRSETLARAIWRMWAGPTAEPGRAGLVGRIVRDDSGS